MNSKKQKFIEDLSVTLSKANWAECPYDKLAGLLNDAGFETEDGNAFDERGGRGISRVVSAAYDNCENPEVKAAIASSFSGKDGKHPWRED